MYTVMISRVRQFIFNNPADQKTYRKSPFDVQRVLYSALHSLVEVHFATINLQRGIV